MKPLLRTYITLLMGVATAMLMHVGYANETITFNASGKSPIVTYTQRHDRVRGIERSAGLTIHADGRVVVHRPVYMIDPGNWEYQLSDQQLQALLQQFSVNGLMDFDAAKVSSDRNTAEQTARVNGMRYAIGDATYSEITLNLSDFSIDGADTRAVNQRISWANIGDDARRFREVSALQGLAAAEKSLIQLLNPRLRDARNIKGEK